jgi:hypothetical protein
MPSIVWHTYPLLTSNLLHFIGILPVVNKINNVRKPLINKLTIIYSYEKLDDKVDKRYHHWIKHTKFNFSILKQTCPFITTRKKTAAAITTLTLESFVNPKINKRCISPAIPNEITTPARPGYIAILVLKFLCSTVF